MGAGVEGKKKLLTQRKTEKGEKREGHRETLRKTRRAIERCI